MICNIWNLRTWMLFHDVVCSLKSCLNKSWNDNVVFRSSERWRVIRGHVEFFRIQAGSGSAQSQNISKFRWPQVTCTINLLHCRDTGFNWRGDEIHSSVTRTFGFIWTFLSLYVHAQGEETLKFKRTDDLHPPVVQLLHLSSDQSAQWQKRAHTHTHNGF